MSRVRCVVVKFCARVFVGNYQKISFWITEKVTQASCLRSHTSRMLALLKRACIKEDLCY
jgi:hypothetical protein